MALNPITFTEAWLDASDNQLASGGGWRHTRTVLAAFVAAWRQVGSEREGEGGA